MLLLSEAWVHWLISPQSKSKTFIIQQQTRTWNNPDWGVGYLSDLWSQCFSEQLKMGLFCAVAFRFSLVKKLNKLQIKKNFNPQKNIYFILAPAIYLYFPVFQFPEVEHWTDVNLFCLFVWLFYFFLNRWSVKDFYLSPNRIFCNLLFSCIHLLCILLRWVTVRGIKSRQLRLSWSNKQCGFHWGVSLSSYVLYIKIF